MKKGLSLVIACVLLVSMFSGFAYAADLDTDEPPVVTVDYAYLANCWAGLTPTGGGWYDVTGGAGCVLSDVTISVTVILQRFNPESITSWDDIVTLTDSNHYSASAGESRYISTPGIYRTHVIANVYLADGTLGENETVNSRHITIS